MTRLTIRLDFASGASLGPGKVQLLEAVETTGSIRKAAASAKMSFRQAWLLLQAIEAMFDEPVIRSVRGGAKGGGAKLTPLGQQIVKHYRGLEMAAADAARADLTALAMKIRSGGVAVNPVKGDGDQRRKRKSLKRRG